MHPILRARSMRSFLVAPRGTLPVVLTSAALVVALTACGTASTEPAPAAGDTSSAPAPESAAPAPAADSSNPGAPPSSSTLPPPAKEAADAALKAYETARDDLASDRTEGLAQAADAIAAGAKTASEGAPHDLKASFDALGAASVKLKASASGKIDDARMAFGEVSEAMVALLSVEPALAQGRFVFECPMTDTYKKWIQVDEQIKNPYMGSRMLGCGMASTWGS